MKDSKKNKKIRSLVIVSSLFAILFLTGTYAWFIGMQTVNVDPIDISIASVDSLYFSLDGISWSSTLDVLNTDAYEGNTNQLLIRNSEDDTHIGLKPISTIGKFDLTSSRLELFEKGSLSATDGGYRLLASQVDNKTKKEDGSFTQGDGYFVFDLFIKNMSGDKYYDKYEEDGSNEEAIYLVNGETGVDGITDSTVTNVLASSKDSGIENSVRVAFAQVGRVSASEYGDSSDASAEVITSISCNADSSSPVTSICRNATIWEPNNKEHTAAAEKWYNTTCRKRTESNDEDINFMYSSDACVSLDNYNSTYAIAKTIGIEAYADVYDGEKFNGYAQTSTDGYLVPVKTFTDEDKAKEGASRVPFMTLAPNSITKVRVYIYLEGMDVDNYDFSSNGKLKVEFGFTKERFDKEPTESADPEV